MKKTKILGGLMALLMATSTATGIADNYAGKKMSNPITVSAAVELGWHQDAHGWWYVIKKDGTYVKDAWRVIAGKRYLFGKDGYMLTGWQKRDNTWYYLHYSSGEMITGWLQDGSDWYYLEPSKSGSPFGWGGMCHNLRFKDNGKVYELDSDGKMIKGRWFDNHTSYAYSDGHLAVGRVIIDKKRYEFDSWGNFVRYW